MRPFPYLFERIKVDVEVLSLTKAFHHHKNLKNALYFKSESDLIEYLRSINLDLYQWIFMADDESIFMVLNSDLPKATKEKLLPVVSSQFWPHLNSKIGMMDFLKKSTIKLPPSFVATSLEDLMVGADRLGFPLLIKKDYSNGGRGIRHCASLSDIYRATKYISDYPVLMQKQMSGKILDLSGFFDKGQLLYFTYSSFEKSAYSAFGPSVLRKYFSKGGIDSKVKEELRELGQRLGLQGFANISCVLSDIDGQRYYFEVDARPNAWIDFGRYIGEDIAPVLSARLNGSIASSNVNTHHLNIADGVLLPNFLRLSPIDILFNRFSCWNYIEHVRLSEVLLYNLMRWMLGSIEARNPFDLLIGRNSSAYKKIQKIYVRLKRNMVNLF